MSALRIFAQECRNLLLCRKRVALERWILYGQRLGHFCLSAFIKTMKLHPIVHLKLTFNFRQLSSRRLRQYVSDESLLLPSRLPPKYSYLDSFPFRIVAGLLRKKNEEEETEKAKLCAKVLGKFTSENLLLEISIYLASLSTSYNVS